MTGNTRKNIAGAMTLVLATLATAPAGAMPLAAAPDAGGSPHVVKVQSRGGYWYDGPRSGYWYEEPGYYYYEDDYYYRERRPPPRERRRDDDNDDDWVPAAVLGAGALILGGVIAASQNDKNQPAQTTVTGINPRHYEWCAQTYRSYRRADNTYQPYNGQRQQCFSPYY
ncbi:BA14K family protein [Martelella alba]|uniref:BA14K family protein n=1 Tax=Martelella alba TaxID=2590451 RepID=UPI001F4306BC|nr:BA14K family protein [Martelella alba]